MVDYLIADITFIPGIAFLIIYLVCSIGIGFMLYELDDQIKSVPWSLFPIAIAWPIIVFVLGLIIIIGMIIWCIDRARG